MFQQNVSETDGSIITSLGRNSEDQLQLRHNYSLLYSEVQQLRTGLRCSSSISTCASLDPLCPSGYYQVELSNGSAVPVYCDMALSCGAVTGGWMRVAELNMTDTSQQCPNGLVERDSSGTRRCEIDDFSSGCFPTMYSTLNVSYTKVCGRITAYQVGSTNSFRRFYENFQTTIDSVYVDGVSLTHGSPRQHIWTFAVALERISEGGLASSACPCQNVLSPPLYVGEDYFCDAGYDDYETDEFGLQTAPLFDETDCLCCDNPPWFYKQLPQPTTDDIEMRVCRDQNVNNENIGIQVITIFIQ